MKKNFYPRFFILLTFLSISVFSLRLTAQTTDFSKLDEYIAKAVTDYEVPGLAIAIVKGDKIVFAKGYGLREAGTDKAITPNSLFGIASCSKAFTATCIGMLVDEGKLNWDDRVVDYLPDFQLHDSYVTRELRIRDLLCHRAGFNTFDGDLLWYGTDYSRKEVVERIRHLPLKNSFRARFGYSNVMFITAGEVVEAVTGKTWDEFVKERIFSPLGMDDSNTSNRDFKKNAERALPHLKGEVVEDLNYDNSGPAASINSSVNDLGKWISMWVNEGQFGGKALISPETWREIISAHTAQNPSNFIRQQGIHFESYALGWGLFDYRGKMVVEHDGGLPGYISKVAMIPEEKMGVVLLTNGMPAVLNMALRNAVFDFMLAGEMRVDWAQSLFRVEEFVRQRGPAEEKERLESRIPKTDPSLKEKEYVGTFEDKMYGTAEVSFKKGQLTLSLLPSKEIFTGEMTHWHYNTFRVDFNDPFLPFGLVTFEFNSAGEVSGFTIDLPNPDFHFFNLHFEKK